MVPRFVNSERTSRCLQFTIASRSQKLSTDDVLPWRSSLRQWHALQKGSLGRPIPSPHLLTFPVALAPKGSGTVRVTCQRSKRRQSPQTKRFLHSRENMSHVILKVFTFNIYIVIIKP